MKNKIKETASRMFQEKGFHQTSMREIAEELQVTKAALYYHYQTKEELFEAIIRDAFQTMNTFSGPISDDADVWDIIRLWIGEVVHQRKVNPHIRRLIFNLMIGRYRNQITFDTRPYLERAVVFFRALLQRGIDNGEIRNDIPFELMLKFIITSVQGVLSEMDANPLISIQDLDEDTTVNALFLMIKGGLKSA